MRCSRHRPRSVRATGTGGGSCRAPNRPRRDPGSQGVNDDPHRQPLAVDQGVDFVTLYLLAGVVPYFVVFAAPFSADLIDWLSRIAADGLASRPIRPCAAQP